MAKQPFQISLMSSVNENSTKDARDIELNCSFDDEVITMLFLIDTGSQISLCKKQFLPENINIEAENATPLVGIFPGELSSLGTCSITIHVDNSEFVHDFHVLDNETMLLKQDAIIGSDFLLKHELRVNFNGDQLSLSTASATAQFTDDFSNPSITHSSSDLPSSNHTSFISLSSIR